MGRLVVPCVFTDRIDSYFKTYRFDFTFKPDILPPIPFLELMGKQEDLHVQAIAAVGCQLEAAYVKCAEAAMHAEPGVQEWLHVQ